jgi:hypothetical protein
LRQGTEQRARRGREQHRAEQIGSKCRTQFRWRNGNSQRQQRGERTERKIVREGGALGKMLGEISADNGSERAHKAKTAAK